VEGELSRHIETPCMGLPVTLSYIWAVNENPLVSMVPLPGDVPGICAGAPLDPGEPASLPDPVALFPAVDEAPPSLSDSPKALPPSSGGRASPPQAKTHMSHAATSPWPLITTGYGS